MIEDKRVYLYNEYGHELEVDLALTYDGIYTGVWQDGPDVGVEVYLNRVQVKEALDLFYEVSNYGE